MERSISFVVALALAGTLFAPTRAVAAPSQDADAGGGILLAAAERLDRNGNGEAYWRNRVAELEGQIAAAKARITALKEQRKREPLIRKERKRRAELAEAQEELAALEEELEVGLPEEAREAGASQRWLRSK